LGISLLLYGFDNARQTANRDNKSQGNKHSESDSVELKKEVVDVVYQLPAFTALVRNGKDIPDCYPEPGGVTDEHDHCVHDLSGNEPLVDRLCYDDLPPTLQVAAADADQNAKIEHEKEAWHRCKPEYAFTHVFALCKCRMSGHIW
jgi:hypothetical protein